MQKTGLRVVVRRGIVDIGIFSLLINVLLLVVPLYLLQVYDRVLPSSSLETLVYLSIIAALSLCFLGLLEIVRSIYSHRAAASIDKKLGSLAFLAALSGSRAEAGDIQPLRDLASVRSFIGSRRLTTLFDLPFAPLFIGLLCFVHPTLFWLSLAGAAIMLLVVVANQFANGKSSALATEQSAQANLSAQAFARCADTLRAMGMTRNATEKWGESFVAGLDHHDRSTTVNALFSGMSRVIRMMLQLAILGVGAWLVLQGEMTAGMIFAASIISGRALQPIDQLIGAWRQVADARRSWKRLMQVFSKNAPQPTKLQLPAPIGALTVKDLVYFAANAPTGSEPILKRINFTIAAGEMIAIIGPSRAGKTTLARLLVGAAEPSSGSIKVDGSDIKTWDEDQLGRYVGYLAQDVQLLPGTIADNVSRFSLDAVDEAIVEAAHHAQAHDLIRSQPDGYQTRIGTGGSALSGGERQRIGLARAFYGIPKILVLDEPNANLDSDGEAALEKALAQAREADTTIIIITHRMSIASTCDRVMMLRNGAIEALGPSADVLRQATGRREASVAVLHPPTVGGAASASFGGVARGAGRWGPAAKAEE